MKSFIYLTLFLFPTVLLAEANWGILRERIHIGTRSEAELKYVTFSGGKIPQILGHIITPIGEFAVKKRIPWAGKDWASAGARRTVSENKLPRVELKHRDKQWLKSSFESYQSRTWFYSVDFGYWVSPNSLKEFTDKIASVEQSGADQQATRREVEIEK